MELDSFEHLGRQQARAIEIHPRGREDTPTPFVVAGSTGPDTQGQREEITYDYLVNATGPKLNFGATPGLGPAGNSLSVCTFERSPTRVLIVDTWHHVPAHAAYLAKLQEALAPGGTISFVEFTLDGPRGPPREHRIAPEALLAEVRGAGMNADRIEVGLPYQYMIVARP